MRSESSKVEERASEGGINEVGRGCGSAGKDPAMYGVGGVRERPILSRGRGQRVWTGSRGGGHAFLVMPRINDAVGQQRAVH